MPRRGGGRGGGCNVLNLLERRPMHYNIIVSDSLLSKQFLTTNWTENAADSIDLKMSHMTGSGDVGDF